VQLPEAGVPSEGTGIREGREGERVRELEVERERERGGGGGGGG